MALTAMYSLRAYRARDDRCEGRCQNGDDEQDCCATATAGELPPEVVAALDLIQHERDEAEHCIHSDSSDQCGAAEAPATSVARTVGAGNPWGDTYTWQSAALAKRPLSISA